MSIHGKNGSRREVLASLGGLGAVGLAGCLGGDDPGDDDDDTGDDVGDDDTGDDDDDLWPPAGGQIDAMIYEGSDRFTQTHQMWASAVGDYMPDDVNVVNTQTGPSPGAASVDQMMNAEPGSAYASNMMNTFSMMPYEVDGFDYDLMEDFIFPVQYFTGHRGVVMNPETMPIDQHFDITWDEFVDYSVDEGPVRFGIVGGHQILHGTLMANYEDDITIGEEWEFIDMPDGDTARQGMLQGNLDAYFAGAISNYETRNDYYLTQFIMSDPDRFPDHAAAIREVTPENGYDGPIPDESFISHTGSFPEDGARVVIDVTMDGLVMILNADTPDHVVDNIVEGFEGAMGDDDLQDNIVSTFSSDTWGPNVDVDEVTELVHSNVSLIHEDEEINAIVEEHMV